MIIPKLYGRLGNQCFQIAAAIAHAKKLQTAYRVPKRTINPKIWQLYFLNLPTPQLINNATANYYREKRHCYDPLPEVDDLTIDGYFQSEKYFSAAKQDIANQLKFEQFDDDNKYVALHIRRGDYLIYPDEFPILPMDYYQQAIDYCIAKGCHAFKIYTDDQTWVRRSFKPDWHSAYVLYNGWPNDALRDMRDMYSASAFIISNSTFSLFPALLRPDEPMVIAPAEHRWYGPKNSHLETCDLMPERFFKI